MTEDFVKTLVRRHNALLEYYLSSQAKEALVYRTGASGLEKEVLERAQARYNKACSLVEDLLGK